MLLNHKKRRRHNDFPTKSFKLYLSTPSNFITPQQAAFGDRLGGL
jgi:hypothetical protein